MAQNPGAMKRQKELARLEWQAEKAAKRKQRAAEKKERTEKEKGVERAAVHRSV
ncbi:MAG: hypothetical protein HY901_37410 [Deltaproteobacteria bacterium]|nr:hypothetical protein [Deltaproteobacteria bacterium]